MKQPSRLLFYCKILSLLILVAIPVLYFTLSNNSLFENEEGEEEGEGIPGIMHAMDMWGDMRTYPFETMQASGFSDAFLQTRAMGRKEQLMNARGSNINTAPWTPLGPMNFAGRTLCLGFHPTNANIIWAGSACGGLWKTTVGGSTGSTGYPAGVAWTYVPTGFPVLGVPAIAVGPGGNTLYIGTGEVYNNAAAASGPIGAGHIRTYRGSYGIGVLKSTDGGTTWTQSLNFSYSNLKGVADIVIDPGNSSIVYAATTDGIYRTIDAGANWTLLPGLPQMAMDLCYKPGSSTVLYATFGDLGTAGAGIYQCNNANAGVPSFTQLTNGLPSGITGKILLSVTPVSPNKIWASIGNEPINQAPPEGMYMSSDNGATWTGLVTNASSILTNQGWYAHDVAVDPTNDQNVYWGELNLYKSTNGGSAFGAAISSWSAWFTTAFAVGAAEGNTASYVHADIHRIYATAANTVYMCTDGGVFRSTDGGANFTSLNGGMQTTQLYANISVSQQDPNYMLAGLQDNEGLIYLGTPNCGKVGGLGDGFHTAIDPTNDANGYIESYYLNAKKSSSKASGFGAMSGSAPVNLGNPPSETVCFNAPLVIAPSTPATMYAGSCLFKKSTNNGSTWSNMNSGNYLSNASTPIIYMAVAPSNANTVYVSVAPGGGARSRLFRTTNGGTSFTEITGTLPDRYYSSIAVDPTDPNRLLVTLSGFTPLATESQIYLSHNGGTSWSNIGGNLPDVPHNTVKFDPNDRSGIYVGTDLGLFYLNAMPTSGVLPATIPTKWTAYNEGLGDAVMVSDLVFTNTTPKKIRLATYGRGLWERALAPINLPVVLKEFKVLSGEKGNQLKWIVSDQVNVSRYEVEYSTDASNFKNIATIPAVSGTGDITYSYLHLIRNDVNGYYRIKMIDQDESFTYSNIEEVKTDNLLVKLSVYPNPTMGVFKIKIPASMKGAFKLKLYDEIGRVVVSKQLQAQQNTGEISVDISRMAAGNYQVVCDDDKAKYVTRILKR